MVGLFVDLRALRMDRDDMVSPLAAIASGICACAGWQIAATINAAAESFIRQKAGIMSSSCSRSL